VRHGSAHLLVGAAVRRAIGTLLLSFQDLDSTKPAGAVTIRVETANSKAAPPPECRLL